ncbi:MFS transporter [Streptomyces sp. TR02-1]|uniref:MFS transporter n=1 Tax=Streptomyces sp. TR02-1 TaxID=3385977 RepID=UPI0039A3C2D6
MTGWWGVVTTPHTARLLSWATIGRLPHGMVPLALVLLVRANGGSYQWGTGLAALYGLALAAGQPVLGRLIDRTGQTRTTTVAALISAAATATLTIDGITGHHTTAAALTLIAGAGCPPLEGSLRALWPLLVGDQAKDAAYSLDATSQEIAHITAPLLVALGALTGGPRGILAAAAALGLAGAAGFATAPPSRTWSPHPDTGTPSALRAPGMWIAIALLAAFGAVIGAVYTAGPAYAELWNTPWLTGALPATLSCAAMVGNALWAYARWKTPLHSRLVTFAATYALSWLGLTTATTPAHALAAIALSGLFFGPLLTTCYHLIDHLAPPGTTTEAFSLLVSAVYLGLAIGTRTAGSHTSTPALPPLLAALVLFALTIALRPVLHTSPYRTAEPLLPVRRPAPERSTETATPASDPGERTARGRTTS